MCKLLRNDNFKRCVLMVLTIQLVFCYDNDEFCEWWWQLR